MDKKLKKVLNLKPHFNIADSIPLYSISDDGITEIAKGLYSRTYKVQDINFGIARRDERGATSAKWASVLKSIDPSYDLQVCIYNHSVDIDYLSDIVLLQEAGDGRDGLRADINQIVRRNMTEGNNGIRRDIYLTLTIPSGDRSMCAEMLSYTPDATQKTAIAVAAKRCYDAWLMSGEDGDIPTLNDFYLALCDYYNSEGGRLQSVLDVVKAVEFYVAGVDTLFQGHSNTNTEAAFISYDISELGEGIRPLAMLIILDSILNRMSRNRKLNRPTFVYIDEIHLLFQKEQTAQWIKKLWKTARKYRCCPCGLSQDVEDLLASDTGRAVLTNTAFVVLLKQQAINASVLSEQLQLSARQLEYVTDTPPGEGLLCIQNASKFTGGVIPFEDHFPEDSLLFEICQTSSMGNGGR